METTDRRRRVKMPFTRASIMKYPDWQLKPRFGDLCAPGVGLRWRFLSRERGQIAGGPTGANDDF